MNYSFDAVYYGEIELLITFKCGQHLVSYLSVKSSTSGGMHPHPQTHFNSTTEQPIADHTEDP